MKTTLKKSLCSLLCCAIFANIPLSALNYTGIGEVTDIHRDTVGDGLHYSEIKSVDTTGKAQHSYIFEYTPSGGVLPVVRWGSKIYGMDRLGSLVSAEGDEHAVLGALNGDFYSLQTGVPLGVMIDGGELISTDDSKYAIGFFEDGEAIIGKPSVKMTLAVTKAQKDAESTDESDSQSAEAVDDAVDQAAAEGAEQVKNTDSEAADQPIEIQINHLNKYPTIWGIYMVTDDFAATTKSTVSSREIVVEFSGDIKASGTVSGIVRDVVTDGYNNAIPEGCAVITAATGTAYAALLDVIEIGDAVTLTTVCAEGWENVVTAIGGGDMILDGGVMPDGIIDEDHEKILHPRTAVGIKANGNVIFFAVDGRTSSSRGLKIADLSALMAELGCVSALNLDGGGSTTVMVKASDSTDCVYVNVPADTSYRGISNGILFLSNLPSDGASAALSVYPKTQYVLGGSTISFSAEVLDSAYMPLGIRVPTDSLTASLDDGYTPEMGSVSGGTFTAGNTAGEYRVTLSADNEDGKISGDVSVLVIEEADSITVSPSSIKINPGTLAKIDITAKYRGKDVVVDRGSFYYTLNGTHVEADTDAYPGAWLICEYGYLDTNGNFQAFGGEYEGQVEIKMTRGDFSHTVNLSIGTAPHIVTDFENAAGIGLFRVNSSVSDMYIDYTTYARRSGGAFEVGFAYENANGNVISITPREKIELSEDAVSVRLWIKGGEASVMHAELADNSGDSYKLPYTVTKDYSRQTGWRELTAVIPSELKGDILTLTSLLSVSASGSASDNIIIDDVSITYGGKDPALLSGVDTHWAREYLYTLYDMGVIEDTDCTPRADGLYYAPDTALTRGEFAKMLSLWLGLDVLGYAEGGVEFEVGTPADKIPYIRAIIDAGLMSGRGVTDDGKVIFDAGATITREEAFKVIGSLVDAREGELSFTDSNKIADWAKSGIAKCIAKGIISGYEDNTVRPKANISRAEFATILSKMG